MLHTDRAYTLILNDCISANYSRWPSPQSRLEHTYKKVGLPVSQFYSVVVTLVDFEHLLKYGKLGHLN